MKLGHLAALAAAVKAAVNPASVKLDAVMVCALLLQAIAHPEKMSACPVVDSQHQQNQSVWVGQCQL